MTYPLELREDTNLRGSSYPVNLFRNVSPAGDIDRNILYLHWHDHFELIFIDSGQAIFHIDTQPYEALPGDMLIVPGGALHVGYAATEDQIEYDSLVFHRSLLGSRPEDTAHERFLSPFLEGRLRFPVRLDQHDPQSEVILDLMRGIKQEYETKPRAYDLIVKARLYLMFSLLARKYLPDREYESAISLEKRMERFKTLILYIQEHYGEKLTVADAAKIVNLTPYHFCKVFKSATGCTFVDYINRYRMDEAERLLLEGRLTVTEVAGQVGCGNLNYFTRLYKKLKGMTPSEARRH